MADNITQGLNHVQLDADPPVTHGATPRAELEATIAGLIERGKSLNGEVELYVSAALEKEKVGKVYHPVEYRTLRNDMRNELAFLNKLADSNIDKDKARHYIVSSNLPYYEALWSAAKRSSGLQCFRKYFYWDRRNAPAGKPTNNGTKKGSGPASKTQPKKKAMAIVDIVAEEGMEWIRVSTVSEKRILFDLAKLGWMNDSDSEDEDAPEERLNDDEEDDEDQIDVVRNARELARAARANPIRGRPPKVHFVLTRVYPGKTPAIDMIINKIRATGAIVQCGDDIPSSLPINEVLPQLLIDPSRALSKTLNIDCTILLALISDISHKPCPILDWYPGEVIAQIKEEADEHLLPTHLYPAIGSHPMVCTKEAADQMNLIVQTLATDTEKLRADLLLGQDDQAGRSSEQLISDWAAISDHQLPSGFTLPIAVQSFDLDTITEDLPAVASIIAEELGPLNKSIFLYGWAHGLTTLSANRGRARQIETLVNEHRLGEGETGPHVWLCGESRSLIAKHGRRRG
jgi:hypothetical protein